MTNATEDEFVTFLRLNGYRNLRRLDPETIAGVHEFIYTDAILLFKDGDRTGYVDRWCFEKGKAEPALDAWDGVGEPQGWHRHPTSGRRREGGDPEKETINY